MTKPRLSEAESLRKMFRLLHGVEPTKAHHPVGAYLPTGQLDGDCSCGRGEWPCDELRAAAGLTGT